jgi:hypothetical protein
MNILRTDSPRLMSLVHSYYKDHIKYKQKIKDKEREILYDEFLYNLQKVQ